MFTAKTQVMHELKVLNSRSDDRRSVEAFRSLKIMIELWFYRFESDELCCFSVLKNEKLFCERSSFSVTDRVFLPQDLSQCKNVMIERGELFLKKISLSRGKVGKLCHTFIKDGAVSTEEDVFLSLFWKRSHICLPSAENPHTLVITSRSEGSGERGSGSQTIYSLCHWITAGFSRVSLRHMAVCSSALQTQQAEHWS